MIVGEDGAPSSIVDVERLQSDATILTFQYAAAAGDDAELDRVARAWTATTDPDYFGYLCAAALSLMVRNVLDPTLAFVDAIAPDRDFRGKLREARDNAEKTLGGTT